MSTKREKAFTGVSSKALGLTEAVKLANGRVVLEASGGVTQGSIAKIAATGVDYASSGALTHSAPNFDVALDIDA